MRVMWLLEGGQSKQFGLELLERVQDHRGVLPLLFADVRIGNHHDLHAGGNARRDAVRGVFEHKALWMVKKNIRKLSLMETPYTLVNFKIPCVSLIHKKKLT